MPEAQPLQSVSELIDDVNSLRLAHGLPAYSVNSILMGTAQGQADYMASTGSITHTGAGGITVTQRLLNAGYPLAGDLSLGGFRSENIVAGFGMSPSDAVASWTGDAPHLHTMLSTDLQEIGAGVAQKDGMIYYVIDCARPTTSGLPQDYTPGIEAQLVGDENIIVPVAMATPNTKGDIIHEVQAGQSLWSIAIAYGVKIKDIQQLNNLGSSTTIYRGDKLLVMHVSAPTPAPTNTPTLVPDTATPSPTLQAATPTIELSPTPDAVAHSSSVNAGVAVAAIAAAALAAAALVAWAGRSRPI